MKRIALLSCDSLEGFFCYDEMLIEPFQKSGFEAELISWRANVDWNEFEAVIIRATWDYQDHCEDFLAVLKKIESSNAVLLNALTLVEWNISKKYLKELQDKGVRIIPTEFSREFDEALAMSLFEKYDCDEIVIKPCVSANSDDTFRLDKEKLADSSEELQSVFKARDHVYQPFIPSVVAKGEYSLFYFGGNFSHAILKTPKSGDFRVQEEHGGSLLKVAPTTTMLQEGKKVIEALPGFSLYARVDFVEYQGKYHLMEVELIEPSLYFNLDEDSAGRFVEAYKNSKSSH